MAKQAPTLYSITKTFIWLTIVSLLLLGCLLAIVYSDHDREWRTWQRKFVLLKTEKIQEELKISDQKIDKKKMEELKLQYEDAEASLKSQKDEIGSLKKAIDGLQTSIVKAMGQYQDLKQYQDSYRYYLEEYELHKDPKSKDYALKLKEIEPKTQQAKLKMQELEKTKELKDAELQTYYQKERAIKRDIDKLLEEKNRVDKKLQSAKPSWVKNLLNAPMLDFLAPSQKIQQIVLDKLYDDYHFAKVQKVDRCTTCHLGIDQKGFETDPQPFRTHPNLDLYLGAASPHPVEKFGCTVCHGGNGHSVSFKDSAHMPQSEEQKETWEKKYHWKMLEKWDDTMLPLKYTQAACAKCHQEVSEVPLADKLNHGRKLAESSGCFTCHKIEGFQDRWRPGPSLLRIDSKLDKDWIVRWLHDPKSFRETTKMPRIFNLTNTSSPEDIAKNSATIDAITTYLLKHSESFESMRIPVEGNKEKGEELVKKTGCLGCHSINGMNTSSFGPELSGLGSKVKPEWLYSWLKDPKHYLKETRMPNFRLSDQEAADITSYLISLKNTSFEDMQAPEAKEAVLDEMVMHYLEETLRHDQAMAELEEMSKEDRQIYLGKKMIAQQGCFSCHTIKGFEDTKPIATELSTEGQKSIHQFDFGLIEMERTRHGWIWQKLKEPRIFDQGKIKSYYEKLRMPDFGFTDEEVEAITTFVLSLREDPIPLDMKRRLDIREKQIEKGRLLVSKFNCNGCHTMDGKEGVLRSLSEDKGQAPPILDGEGAKVQEQWLHHFLREPKAIRPWLSYRMPTFGFNESELTDWVFYFNLIDNQDISYKGLELPVTTLEKLHGGKQLFGTFQCAKCHQVNAQSAAMGSSFLAPDLKLTKTRLKPTWVTEWLKDPQMLQPDTMMPTFFSDGQTPVEDMLGGDAQQQIEAIRDYLYIYEPELEEKEKKPETNNTVAK